MVRDSCISGVIAITFHRQIQFFVDHLRPGETVMRWDKIASGEINYQLIEQRIVKYQQNKYGT